MKLKRYKSKSSGQTFLEYMLILSMIILPLAAAIRTALQDSENGESDNLVRSIVSDAYGDEKKMGAIGRPYP